MSDIAERVAAAKKQVEDLKKQVKKARDQKMDGYSGIDKLGKHYKQRKNNDVQSIIV
jgi:hypothetical protein